LNVRRLLVPLLVTLALCGCGRGADEAFVDSRVPPALGPRFYPPDGWAWGVLREPGAPAIRYGVASPPVAPRAHVVLLPGYGESAEVYYETARDLLDRGYTVWVLEAAGQGGSGRFGGARDVGRSKGFGVDARALGTLVRQVVRPAGTPVVAAATGTGALSALLAAEDGQPLDGLVLWSPVFDSGRDVVKADSMVRWGLGGLRAADSAAWKRPDRDLSGRETLPLAWQTANPDLRMGGPSWGWVDAQGTAARLVREGDRLKRVKSPVLLFEEQGRPGDAKLCAALPRCTAAPHPSAGVPLHLAADPARRIWLESLTGFVEARVAERDHAA
jgi:lysophospholipase